jgi:hypothetical protein
LLLLWLKTCSCSGFWLKTCSCSGWKPFGLRLALALAKSGLDVGLFGKSQDLFCVTHI